MASEQGGVSAAAPLLGASLPEPTTIVSAANTSQLDPELSRIKSLKRSRPEQTQSADSVLSITNTGLRISPSPKSPRYKGSFSPGFAPIPLTGAAAMADERERRKQEESQKKQQTSMSENPGHKALSSLIAGGGVSMSKPQDAPAPTANMSEGMAIAANAISIPSPRHIDEKTETSPASVTSLASLGSSAQTATAGSTVVASPVSLTSAVEGETREVKVANGSLLQTPTDEQSSNRALSFPGNVLAQQNASRIPPRGMSLPMPGQNQHLAPRSPSQKKHKCPYCETEFTRHHNLKSHLLTHSQEKPYVCQTCTMRFRRLHDLKRHMKLHTGERPHICPKCDRKFARGDALARHSKGQGGCAGRRASMGSFGGDDDYEGSNAGDGDESGMDGIMYTNGASHPNEAEMTEEDRRRFSLPSIKAQHVGDNKGSSDSYAPHPRPPSTYPPAGPRQGQSTGGLFPPNADRGGSIISGPSPSIQTNVYTPTTSNSSIPISAGGSSIFPQNGMTESPKPLSPGGMHSHQLGHDQSSLNRQRSPSLTTQFQQQQFGRRQSDRVSPTGISLPSPHNTSHVPKLPSIAGLAPPDQRYTLSSHGSNQQNITNGPQVGQQGQPSPGGASTASFQSPQDAHSNRVAPWGPQSHPMSGASDNSANLFDASDERFANYVKGLEGQVKQLQDKVQNMESKEKAQEDKINRLSEELYSLRNQLNAQNQPQRPQIPGHS